MGETEELKSLRKSLEKLLDQHEELKKDYATTAKELQNASLELSKVRRRVDESKLSRESAIHTKAELDVEYKRATEIKKENEIKIRELIAKNSELQFAVDSRNNNKVENEQKKARDIQEVEQEKESLKTHQRQYDRQLDEERRALQSKFIDAKLELKKTFQKEVEDLKIRHDKQISELERNSRLVITEITENSEKKISTLEQESHQLRAKLDYINRTTAEREATIADLDKKLRRELLNVEVMGTSKIDYIKEQSTPAEMVRLFKAQEKKIQQLRLKLNETEDEVAFETRQTDQASNAAKELERELHSQELQYRRLEATKDDLEKRLQERVEQLERELNAKNMLLQAEFDNVQVQLEASITDKDDLIKALKAEIGELSDLSKDSRQSNVQLSTKLAERLDTDRVKFMELDRARRDAAAEARKAKKELEEFKQVATNLEQDATKYKKQYFARIQQIEALQANNQKLEKAERRLQTRT